MKFDIFLCCAIKDFNKLPYLLESIQKNVKAYENIYLTTPVLIEGDFIDKYRVKTFLDKEILDINPIEKFRVKPGWIYQMFLKMFQNVTENDYYVTIDTDVIINSELNFFEDGKPVWYLGRDQNHEPYFNFQKKVFGFGREYNHSFINDMNFFNKKIINEILTSSGYTVDSFIDKTSEILNKDCVPGEPEIYGNYVYKTYPEMYKFKKIKTTFFHKTQKNSYGEAWTDDEIKQKIQEMRDQDYDMFMIHSWPIDRSDDVWN